MVVLMKNGLLELRFRRCNDFRWFGLCRTTKSMFERHFETRRGEFETSGL
ncbi:hypothetical protein BDR03DRAFT_952345 [Suillus americanus]|nr:hypothetical protein BDR03DRAFT_952345 [Suillus americanus]